ncbi:MAG: Ig-like domain repeat protein [Acidobacteriia bacterium]|nr:Ig-like domain repeat protein [Terriglobia bacterium]
MTSAFRVRRAIRGALLSGFSIAILFGLAAPARAQVTIVDLGAINGGENSSANAINSAGHVAGGAYDASYTIQHPVMWVNGAIADLGLPCADCSATALGINDNDQVVGMTNVPGGYRGFLWQNGAFTLLPPLPADQNSIARAINIHGAIVGQSISPNGTSQPVMWVNGVPQGLGVFGGNPFGSAFGINDAGQVVGQAAVADGGLHAFLWQGGVMTDLGQPADPGACGDLSSATAINGAGEIAGWILTNDCRYVALRWIAGVRQELPPLAPANQYSVPAGINSAGDIVGNATNANGAVRAVLWRNGAILDLGTLLSYSLALGINDTGVIVGRSQMPPPPGNNERGVLFLVQQNSAPAFIAPTPFAPLSVPAGSHISFIVRASDPDAGDTVNVNVDVTTLPPASGSGTNGPANPADRTFDWTPQNGDVGPHTIVFQAFDQHGASTAPLSVTVNVTPDNPPFYIAPTPFAPIPVVAGTPVSFTVSAQDPDPGDLVHIDVDISTLPPGAGMDASIAGNPASRTFTWTPTSGDAGQHTITFTASDLGGATAPLSVVVNVTAPVLTGIYVTPNPAGVHAGRSQQFTAHGVYSDGSQQILSSGGGGAITGNPPSWSIHFFTGLPAGACSPTPIPGGFLSQGITLDPMGNVVPQAWGGVVQVDGQVTANQVSLNLNCVPPFNVGPGTLTASWTGTRYEGSFTFAGVTGNVVITGWSSKATMPAPRFSFGAAAVNGIVYVIGGANQNGFLSQVDAYTPANNTWMPAVSSIPTVREGLGVVAQGGLIYAIGGLGAGAVPTGAVDIFDPVTNQWTSGAAMPTPRGHVSVVGDGTYLYVIGGDTGPNLVGQMATVERYDPAANAWTPLAPMPLAGSFASAGVLMMNGQPTIVVVGLFDPATHAPVTEKYTIATNSWSAGVPMSPGRSLAAAGVVNNTLWVVGGNVAGQVTTHAQGSFPATNTQPEGWAGTAWMPTPRQELAAVVVGDVLYALGGMPSTSPVNILSTNEALTTPPVGDLNVSQGGGVPAVMWSSTNPAVASIDANGNATTMTTGQTTIIASAGNISCQTTGGCATLSATNTAPTVQITGRLNIPGPPPLLPGPFTINEGSNGDAALQLVANGADQDGDPLTFSWSIVSGPGALGTLFGSVTSGSVSFVNGDGPSDTTVRVVVSDPFGGSVTATTTIHVNNVAPTVTIFGPSPITIDEGSIIFGGGNFFDPGSNDAPWTVTVNFGDGTGDQPLGFTTSPAGSGIVGNFQIDQPNHVYRDNGTYIARVTVTDKDGGIGSATVQVNVNNRAPQVSGPNSSQVPVFNTSTFACITFSDRGTLDAPWTATVDFGDGGGPQPIGVNVPSTCGGGGNTIGSFNLSHAYQQPGQPQVAVKVTDKDGGVGTFSFPLTVTKATTGTFVNSSSPTSSYGAPVTFTATVSRPPNTPVPTGTVTFKDNGNVVATQNVNANSQATFTTNTLTLGGHTIQAVYNGDAIFNPCGLTQQNPCGSINQTVNAGQATVTITATPDPSAYGTLVTIRADVTSLLATPTGTIFFSLDGTFPLVQQQVPITQYASPTDGFVTITTSSLPVGVHTVRASFTSSSPNLQSRSNTTTVTINRPPAPVFSRVFDSPPGTCICTPMIRLTAGYGAENWYAKADASGQLIVTLVLRAQGNDPATTVNARVFDAADNQVAQITASYPAGVPVDTQARATAAIASTPDAVYRVEVSAPTVTNSTTRYWVKFEGAREAATASPLFPAAEGRPVRWLFNVDAADPLLVRVFSQGTFQPPPPGMTENVTFQWVSPGGQASAPQTVSVATPPGIDQIIPPPSNLTPGIWTLFIQADKDYRLEKTSGTDRGIYVNYLSGGFGSVHVPIVDGHGNPFTGTVQFTVTQGADVFSFSTDQGSFDAGDAESGVYHVQVTAPPGLKATPSEFDLTILCDREADQTIVIADATPPVLTAAPADITAEATSPSGAIVTYTPPTATDAVDGPVPVTCVPASGSTFPLGATTVVCSATDAGGNTASESFTVTVVDTTPPVIASVTPSAASLWPPNHQMVGETVGVSASDLAGAVSCTVTSVGSSEPVNGLGDGDTAPDWAITGPLTVNLRAERAGNGPGRVYTIGVMCSDQAGNTSRGSAQVMVPHDRK